ncbi:MAG: hypothetical protein WCW40_08875 [Bacteroidota bacterium]
MIGYIAVTAVTSFNAQDRAGLKFQINSLAVFSLQFSPENQISLIHDAKSQFTPLIGPRLFCPFGNSIKIPYLFTQLKFRHHSTTVIFGVNVDSPSMLQRKKTNERRVTSSCSNDYFYTVK